MTSTSEVLGNDPLDTTRFDAILFDLDGVLTETATIHYVAWKAMFDEYLRTRAQVLGEDFREFTEDDFLRCVDGRPRLDGIRTFLDWRGIDIPEGGNDDPSGADTITGLGNRKNEKFHALVDDGVAAFSGAVRFVDAAHQRGIETAVVSSSANAARVLAAAGIAAMFATRIDGVVARDLGLAGKPAPDTYLEAARRLGVDPHRAVVVEDALSGVQAGRDGNFGLVIGIGPDSKKDELLARGADIVVAELGELVPD